MHDLAYTWTEKLLEVTSAFSRARTPREVGEVAVGFGVGALGAKSAILSLLSRDAQHLDLVASAGLPPADREQLARLPLEARHPGVDAVREGRPVFLETEREVLSRYGRDVPGRCREGSSLSIPVLAGERAVGFLGFGFGSYVPIPPGPRAFVQALATLGTQALERARLLDAEQQARRRLKVLVDAAEAFSAPTLSMAAVLDAIVRKVTAATGDVCVLRLLSADGAWLEPRAWFAADPGLRKELSRALDDDRQAAGEGQATRFLRGGQTLLVPSLAGTPLDGMRPAVQELFGRHGVDTLIVAPLQIKGRRIGTLEVGRAQPHGPYGDEDRLLAEGLAARAASAIEKTRLYDEVVRSQRLFEGIAEASPDVLYLLDVRRGRNVFVSRSVEQVVGRTPREIAGLGEAFLVTLIHPDDLHRLRGGYQRFASLPDGEMVEHEYRLRHADETWRWVRSRDRIFSRTPSGEPELVLGVARDVTEQVRLAREREELLAREQQARLDAETASRAKDEFLAMLGHELRNPLSPMITALELMRMRGGDAFARERTIVERQVQHLVRLVDDLLDISRITRGKVELKRRPIELGEVVAAAIEMASPLLESRRHRLEADVPRRGLVVQGDPDRLGQVVANLLTNAAKYTEPGGTVWVRAAREGGEVVVRVRDSGIGIACELLPRVFDLFVQGQRALDRSQGGLGLGLSIVRSMVEMHGGTVTAASRGAGLGSEFTVRLPAFEVARAPTPLPRPSAAPHLPGRGRRVLVVDDNQDAADALVEALVSQGHAASAAYDGPTGIEAARRHPPEVAFLDIGLPVMDGYELARRLRELLGSTVKLVALTGYGQDRDRAFSRAAGFDEHLVKPVELEQIMTVLGEADPELEAVGLSGVP
ncbi:MAG TPA: ATP-binding protein [Anaeromyxobacteraceae bacterium]